MTPTVLVVLPVRDGEPAPGGREVVAEALRMDSAARTLMVSSPGGSFAPAGWASTLAPLVARLDPVVVLLPASPDGRDLAPHLAAHLGRPLVAGALEVRLDRATVPCAGALAQRTVTYDVPVVATLQQGVRTPQGDVGWAESVQVVVDQASTARGTSRVRDPRLVGLVEADAATMDLAEARRVVGGGAGLLDVEDPAAMFATLTDVGVALGASMGATRVVTDAGWVGHERQIGTTGVVIGPEVYLAFGISGAVQHTAGLGHPAHVISVNLDPHCPMMAMADLAVVADARATLEELARLLRDQRPDESGAARADGASHRGSGLPDV